MGNYASVMTIEEVNPGNGKQARRIVLAGSGLPFMGAEWGFSNKLITTWYPGNGDEASQQNLGPRELPSSWEGAWKRTLLPRSGSYLVDDTGTQTPAFAPVQLREAFEAIGREGGRLRVSWRVSGDDPDQNSSIVREGRISEARFPHDRLQDIRWNITFDWQSRGARTQKPISTRDANLVTAIAALNAAQANLASTAQAKFIASNNNVRASASNFTLGQLEALTQYPNQLVNAFGRNVTRVLNQMKQLATIAAKIRAVPFQVASTAVDFARNATYIANQMADQMGRAPFELASLKSGVTDMLRGFRYFGRVTDSALLVTSRAADLDAKLRATVSMSAPLRSEAGRRRGTGQRQGELIAVHVPKSGETSISLSIKYYGNPDHGPDIMKANRLPWYQVTLTPGKPLIIPVLATAQGTSVSGGV